MSTDNTRRWIKGIPYEVAFWQSYYNNRKRLRDLFGWSLIGQECVLDNFDMAAFLAARKEEKPVILDVGCALSYAFGTKIGGKDLDIDFIDPLAPFYNKILDKHKPELPHIKFGMTESLGAIYPENSVTFIHIRNSLDHSMNPMKGILQAVDCLKPGGVLYLNHFRNEAENEGYRGFHQFNIDIRKGTSGVVERHRMHRCGCPSGRLRRCQTLHNRRGAHCGGNREESPVGSPHRPSASRPRNGGDGHADNRVFPLTCMRPEISLDALLLHHRAPHHAPAPLLAPWQNQSPGR